MTEVYVRAVGVIVCVFSFGIGLGIFSDPPGGQKNFSQKKIDSARIYHNRRFHEFSEAEWTLAISIVPGMSKDRLVVNRLRLEDSLVLTLIGTGQD